MCWKTSGGGRVSSGRDSSRMTMSSWPTVHRPRDVKLQHVRRMQQFTVTPPPPPHNPHITCRLVPTTAEGTPILGRMNTALCDFWYYYYYYAAFNTLCVGHKNDESQAQDMWRLLLTYLQHINNAFIITTLNATVHSTERKPTTLTFSSKLSTKSGLDTAYRWTTLYHGCARSLASGRSHMRVLPPGTLYPTTSVPWLILSSSENCWNHSILVKLLTFVDFCVSLCALASGWLL